jgi:hypothetical protein
MLMKRIAPGIAMLLFVWGLHVVRADDSASVVKAAAAATPVGPDGKQTVTITLEMPQHWHIHANPVRHPDLEDARTKITFAATQKVVAQVKYPGGKLYVDGKDELYVYDGRTMIQAQVQRSVGDKSPLQITIDVNACKEKVDGADGCCLLPGKIKLTVP